MRVLLLNGRTRLYLKTPDSWTAEPESATDFGSSLEAARFACQNSLNDLEIFLDFGDQEYNVYLPVEERLRYP